MGVKDIEDQFQRITLQDQGIDNPDKMSSSVSREEFNLLQEQFKKLTAQSYQSSKKPNVVIIEKDPPPSHGKGLKPTKLPEYHGDRSTYPSWRTAVLDIFRMDWNTFGYDDSRAFVMIYAALKGAALKRAGPFYEAGGVHGTRKPEDFIEFLDRLNLDPLRVARANAELHKMKMRVGQRWPDFLASWCNKLTEARGDFWDDRNKISMLQAALSDQLITTMAGNHLIPNDDFDEFVRVVNQVAQQLEMVEARTGGHKNRPPHQFRESRPHESRLNHEGESRPSQRSDNSVTFQGNSDQVGHIDSSGDTIMGGINAAGLSHGIQRRAKWKNKAQIEKLRLEGRCYRCERQGCIASRCPLLPAVKPKNKNLFVNTASLPEIDPSLYDVVDENIDSEN